jgi:hypothetical protein
MSNVNVSEPFWTLGLAEKFLDNIPVTGDNHIDYLDLELMLQYERRLDRLRSDMYEMHKHGTKWANNYCYRELMVRHLITVFASKLDKEVIDKVTGEKEVEQSVVGISIKNHEIYPEPKKIEG